MVLGIKLVPEVIIFRLEDPQTWTGPFVTWLSKQLHMPPWYKVLPIPSTFSFLPLFRSFPSREYVTVTFFSFFILSRHILSLLPRPRESSGSLSLRQDTVSGLNTTSCLSDQVLFPSTWLYSREFSYELGTSHQHCYSAGFISVPS